MKAEATAETVSRGMFFFFPLRSLIANEFETHCDKRIKIGN